MPMPSNGSSSVTTWRELGRLRAKHSTYRRRRERAQTIAREFLALCRRPFVAFSTGKDSLALALIIHEIAPDVPLRFCSAGETRLLHRNTDQVLDWVRSRGMTVDEVCIDRFTDPAWRAANWETVRRDARRDLRAMPFDADWDGFLMGVRLEESRTRRIALRRFRTPDLPPYCYRYQSGMLRACPLAEWETVDVAAELSSAGAPVLETYDIQGMEARTTARITQSGVRQGLMMELKQRDRAAYQQIIARYPELQYHDYLELP